ncbi:MAG: FAD-dependent oxidoreductase, partial [Leuconostoc lactis]
YDKLVLATGAEQVSLGIAGHELQGIYQIKNLQEGLEVERHLASDDVKDVAIIGGGYIGVEIAEAIRSRGKNVRIFEAKSHMMMSHYDELFGERVEARLRDVGVQIHLDEEVIAYSGENGAVKQLTTPYDTYETDMVILTMGFLPNTALGREHLDLYTNGAYIVNDKQQTSEPDVYAVGDCATSYSNVLHELVVNFSVSDAMRGAYVAAQNIIGEPISSSGTQRTNAVTVYGLNLFSTGVTVNEAELYGIDYQYVDYEDWQKPTFMPENHRVRLRLVYHAQNRRLIGAQVCSEADQAGVLYLLSLAIQKEVTIDEIKVSDFFFYPYFNQPTNFIIKAARLAK